MGVEKTERVFNSWVRQDGRADLSPLIYYDRNSPYLYMNRKVESRIGRTITCVAMRLSEFSIIYPELKDSQITRLLRDYSAVEMFKKDFEEVRRTFERSIEDHFPYSSHRLGRSAPTRVSYRDQDLKSISAKKALALKKKGLVYHQIQQFRDGLHTNRVESIYEILKSYGVKSPYGRDAYDLMKYFNKAHLNGRYTLALRGLGDYGELDLLTEPLRVNLEWTFVEDEVDATLLTVAVPFEEKFYLTEW